jgi:Chalcone isomerase-like
MMRIKFMKFECIKLIFSFTLRANPIVVPHLGVQNRELGIARSFDYRQKTGDMMRFIKQCLTALAALVVSISASAATVDVGGIKIEDSQDLQGNKLSLNGAGVRFKAVFKVYAAGLYVGKKVSTPEELLAAPGPKRMSITLLREIDSNELGKAFTKGFEENSPKSEMSKLIPGLIKMGQIFSDQKKMVAGENFTIDWIPGTGTVITVKGKVQGEPFKEPEFYAALMRIWLGPNPADYRLKDALMGKPS